MTRLRFLLSGEVMRLTPTKKRAVRLDTGRDRVGLRRAPVWSGTECATGAESHDRRDAPEYPAGLRGRTGEPDEDR